MAVVVNHLLSLFWPPVATRTCILRPVCVPGSGTQMLPSAKKLRHVGGAPTQIFLSGRISFTAFENLARAEYRRRSPIAFEHSGLPTFRQGSKEGDERSTNKPHAWGASRKQRRNRERIAGDPERLYTHLRSTLYQSRKRARSMMALI